MKLKENIYYLIWRFFDHGWITHPLLSTKRIYIKLKFLQKVSKYYTYCWWLEDWIDNAIPLAFIDMWESTGGLKRYDWNCDEKHIFVYKEMQELYVYFKWGRDISKGLYENYSHQWSENHKVIWKKLDNDYFEYNSTTTKKGELYWIICNTIEKRMHETNHKNLMRLMEIKDWLND